MATINLIVVIRLAVLHMPYDCPNLRNTPLKCALYSGNHLASYKGCSIYRDFQQRKNPKSSSLKSDNINSKNLNVQDCHPRSSLLIHSSVSQQTYAQATSNSFSNNNTTSSPSDLNKIMLSFLDDIKLLINPLITLLTKVISSLLLTLFLFSNSMQTALKII